MVFLLVLNIKLILKRNLFQGKVHGEVSFDCVRCYEKRGIPADYVFGAKQKPKMFKRSDDVTSSVSGENS